MNLIVINSIRFVLFVLAQGLILNNLEFGWGAMPMLYPLFLLMLPVDTKPVVLMLIAFLFGIAIDSMSNTFGLHASAAVIFAFFRPIIFKAFSNKETIDNVEVTNVFTMGTAVVFYD
jgi:rod shape-determining protein MreD